MGSDQEGYRWLGLEFRLEYEDNVSVRVRAMVKIRGRAWVSSRIKDRTRCDSADLPKTIGTGSQDGAYIMDEPTKQCKLPLRHGARPFTLCLHSTNGQAHSDTTKTDQHQQKH